MPNLTDEVTKDRWGREVPSHQQVAGMSEYTDEMGGWCIVLKPSEVGIWGFYRSEKGFRISDSQFIVTSNYEGDNWIEYALDALVERYNCYSTWIE